MSNITFETVLNHVAFSEAMGGIAGRVDALFGSVEAQKTTGCLHYHYFMYAQRLHQYASLKEIGDNQKQNISVFRLLVLLLLGQS